MSKLFEQKGSHSLYEFFRDPAAKLPSIDGYASATSEQREQKLNVYLAGRNRMEKAWQTFERSAENNFLDGLRTNFWPGWFELYLQYLLIEFGLDNEATNKEGEPDFIVHKSGVHLFDIEATMPKPGTGANAAPNFPTPGSAVQVHNVSDTIWDTMPDGKIKGDRLEKIRNPKAQSDYCLRITATLAAKLDQINRWKATGGVDPTTVPVAVAISTAQIEYETWGWITESLFERVLFGKGDEVIPFDSNGKPQRQDSYFDKNSSMTNKNDSQIRLALFDQPEYNDISAVAFFPDWVLDYKDKLPIFFLNPNAPIPFPTDILQIGHYKTLENSSVKVVVDYRQ